MIRVVISLLVLGASLALWLGLRVRQLHGRGVTLGTGLISGAVNGAAAVGGLPVVLYFLSASAPARVVRATLMVYLVFLGCYGLAVASWQGFSVFQSTVGFQPSDVIRLNATDWKRWKPIVQKTPRFNNWRALFPVRKPD